MDPSGSFRTGFPTTRWSLVARAGAQEASEARDALETLLRRYWRPVYSYVRAGWARTHADAEDLVQAFFACVLEKGTLADADPLRGRFRGFLKGALRHFLLHEAEKRSAQKRGAGRLVPLDDGFDPPAPDAGASPEGVFDREWARQLLRDALVDLERELAAEGKLHLLRALRAHDLREDGLAPGYAGVAAELGIKESDVRNHLHVARSRLRRAVRDRIMDTVSDPAEVEREIGELFP